MSTPRPIWSRFMNGRTNLWRAPKVLPRVNVSAGSELIPSPKAGAATWRARMALSTTSGVVGEPDSTIAMYSALMLPDEVAPTATSLTPGREPTYSSSCE